MTKKLFINGVFPITSLQGINTKKKKKKQKKKKKKKKKQTKIGKSNKQQTQKPPNNFYVHKIQYQTNKTNHKRQKKLKTTINDSKHCNIRTIKQIILHMEIISLFFALELWNFSL